MKEEDNQRDQGEGLSSPYPCPLGFLPLDFLFPYSYPYPAKGVGNKKHKRPDLKSLYKRVADAHLVPF